MKKIGLTCLLGVLLFLATANIALAEEYTVPLVINGEAVTLTMQIDEGIPITVSLSITDATIGTISTVSHTDAVTNEWGSLVENPLERVKTQEDRFSKTTFYIPDVEVMENNDLDAAMSGLHLAAYVGEKESQVWLRLIGVYVVSRDSRFLSPKDVWIVSGDDSFYISLAGVLVDTDFNTYTHSGQFDMLADDTAIEALKAVATNLSGEIRMRDAYGRTFERVMNSAEIESAKIALAVFSRLGGILD